MKKLSILDELNGTCPKCKKHLTFDIKREKAKDLRKTSWIIFTFFIIAALPRLTEFIHGEVPIANPGWWIIIALTVTLGSVFVILRVKIKKFEAVPQQFAHCSNCQKTWLCD